MSIEVSCECGKRFTVGDQFAGKRGRCKACGRTVTVPAILPTRYPHALADEQIPEAKIAAQPQAAETRGPALPAYPSFHRPGRGPAQQSASARIHVSPKIVLLVLLAITIPAGIYLINQGPVKARNELAQIEPTAEGNITTQITRAIQYVYAAFAFGDDEMGTQRHKSLNVVFEDPVIMMHLPDSLQIQGRTTEGNYKGQFHPRTMRFEADVPIMGTIHKVEGSLSDVDQSLTLDGKKIN
ncbi:MAG TPA: hypothetical protein VGG44_01780 [Tepidisphaeraceae bacterium]|jgi:hypothetical protein